MCPESGKKNSKGRLVRRSNKDFETFIFSQIVEQADRRGLNSQTAKERRANLLERVCEIAFTLRP